MRRGVVVVVVVGIIISIWGGGEQETQERGRISAMRGCVRIQ